MISSYEKCQAKQLREESEDPKTDDFHGFGHGLGGPVSRWFSAQRQRALNTYKYLTFYSPLHIQFEIFFLLLNGTVNASTKS